MAASSHRRVKTSLPGVPQWRSAGIHCLQVIQITFWALFMPLIGCVGCGEGIPGYPWRL
ncbi:hypothetical protein BJX63DRAFT_396044 [Aspergillus granulosus]|uniref:Uncharacterized protein n=1 Tax=Aspergillus granulosus TaxID=176169 RepID=A0ABR4HBB4_9EURO